MQDMRLGRLYIGTENVTLEMSSDYQSPFVR